MGNLVSYLSILMVIFWLLVIVYQDYRWRFISNKILLLLFASGTMWLLLEGMFSCYESCVGVIILPIPLLVASLVTNTIGGGDVKLMAVLGWLVGYIEIYLIFALGIAVAVFYYGMKIIITGQWRQLTQKVPMGIYWGLSGLVVILGTWFN